MLKLSSRLAFLLLLFFTLPGLAHAQEDNTSSYIQLIKEVVAKLRFCRFSGSFEPILHSFPGVNIRMLILTPGKECKIGQNNPENRRTLSFATTSKVKKKRKENKQQPSGKSTPVQALLPEPYKSVQLLPFNPDGWYSNAHEIKKIFKENKINVAIEVGCWLGLSTRHIATMLQPNGKLYAVDHWLGSVEHQGRLELPTLYDQFLSNVIHANLTNIIVPIRMSSLEAAAQMRLMGVIPDFIYIDASHDTESVLDDLNAWFPFVEGHGIICGDDWSWGGVRTAVEIFAQAHQLTIDASSNFWRLVEK